jgi:transposase
MGADRTSHASRQAFGPASPDMAFPRMNNVSFWLLVPSFAIELRAVLDAILYIARTGCQWRMLPKDFPPFTTVQGYFYDWRDCPG